VIHDHLTGKHVVGIYPLLTDETCAFVAVDLDGDSWREDVKAFRATAREMGVWVAVERSRSGNGAHCWIFFEDLVPATLARKLGCMILTAAMERNCTPNLNSYDRLFPNQDTMPKGGFGNLIALPLQREPRSQGNSVFVDDDMIPCHDQWAYMSGIVRLSTSEAERLVSGAEAAGRVISVRPARFDQDALDEWTQVISRQVALDTQPMPSKTTRLVRADRVYLTKQSLPPALVGKAIRLAAFQNPDFHRAQAMRLSTFGKPRVICCAEDLGDCIALPRGCFDDVVSLLGANDYSIEITDERSSGNRIDVEFRGELRAEQREAASALLSCDCGVLSAGTAFGKTVVGAWLIAARKVSTLVLVHRQQLMDQWKERLEQFLDIEPAQVGRLGGGHSRVTGVVDIAMLQSLGRREALENMISSYGQAIVDECHHIPAFTFEQVLKHAPARYVVGLTATPIRRDGHHPIIVMQCGPVVYRSLSETPGSPKTIVRPTATGFQLSWDVQDPGIQEIYAQISADEARNNRIVSDVLAALREGRSPLLLTERKDHVQVLADKLAASAVNAIVMTGGMGRRQRLDAMKRLRAIPTGEPRLLIATGRYIGEGFDDSRLDALFLAMPVSWRGTLQQYAGRLHRAAQGKTEVIIYDYVDLKVPVLASMYAKRRRGYRAMGFEIVT
jgi:superfamily II DNA or RNA helicase